MEEIIYFDFTVGIPFQKLKRFEMKGYLENELKSQSYNTQPFIMKEILDYHVLDIPVAENSVFCRMRLKILCDYPRIGKTISIYGFEVIDKMHVVYTSHRLQIIALKPEYFSKDEKYLVKIEKVNIFSKDILCVAAIVGIDTQ